MKAIVGYLSAAERDQHNQELTSFMNNEYKKNNVSYKGCTLYGSTYDHPDGNQFALAYEESISEKVASFPEYLSIVELTSDWFPSMDV